MHAPALRAFHSASHGSSREQHAAVRFEETAGDAVEVELGIATIEFGNLQDFVRHGAALQNSYGLIQSRVVVRRQPEDTGFLKEIFAHGCEQIFPLDERLL